MIGLDAYSRHARFAPAVLVLLPVGLAVAVWFPDGMLGWGALTGLISTTGLAVLLAELARRPGKAREEQLFKAWGGKPTTQWLRHRDHGLDAVTRRRYHDCLRKLIPGMQVPTEQDELRDPDGADTTYESCTRFLIEQTRDRKRFPLVFKELVSYGFSRNLWGLKPLGIVTSAVGLCAAAIRFGMSHSWTAMRGPSLAVAIASGLMLLAWLLVIKPLWVRPVAFAYARALLASCEVLKPADARA